MENQTVLSLQGFLKKREYSEEELRFMQDLEFVQGLCNPFYLKCIGLADNHYFDDPAFINYLKYLQYCKKPEYAKYIVYPQCLYFLDKLQDESFRFLLNDQVHINFLNLESHVAVREHCEQPKEDGSDIA